MNHGPGRGIPVVGTERDDLDFGTWYVDKVCQKHVASLFKFLFCTSTLFYIVTPYFTRLATVLSYFSTISHWLPNWDKHTSVALINTKLSASLIDQQTAHLYHHGLYLCFVCAPERVRLKPCLLLLWALLTRRPLSCTGWSTGRGSSDRAGPMGEMIWSEEAFIVIMMFVCYCTLYGVLPRLIRISLRNEHEYL